VDGLAELERRRRQGRLPASRHPRPADVLQTESSSPAVEPKEATSTASPSHSSSAGCTRQPLPTSRSSELRELEQTPVAARRLVVYIPTDLTDWLATLQASAKRRGNRVSASAIVRIALERLRSAQR
jgi:hypothetical protein